MGNSEPSDSEDVFSNSLIQTAAEVEQFLSIFKNQVMAEMQYDKAALISARILAQKSMTMQWEIIKTIASVLMEHLGKLCNISAIVEHQRAIELILKSIIEQDSPFRFQEYQLPFQTLKLLSELKNGVHAQNAITHKLKAVDIDRHVIIPTNAPETFSLQDKKMIFEKKMAVLSPTSINKDALHHSSSYNSLSKHNNPNLPLQSGQIVTSPNKIGHSNLHQSFSNPKLSSPLSGSTKLLDLPPLPSTEIITKPTHFRKKSNNLLFDGILRDFENERGRVGSLLNLAIETSSNFESAGSQVGQQTAVAENQSDTESNISESAKLLANLESELHSLLTSVDETSPTTDIPLRKGPEDTLRGLRNLGNEISRRRKSIRKTMRQGDFTIAKEITLMFSPDVSNPNEVKADIRDGPEILNRSDTNCTIIKNVTHPSVKAGGSQDNDIDIRHVSLIERIPHGSMTQSIFPGVKNITHTTSDDIIDSYSSTSHVEEGCDAKKEMPIDSKLLSDHELNNAENDQLSLDLLRPHENQSFNPHFTRPSGGSISTIVKDVHSLDLGSGNVHSLFSDSDNKSEESRYNLDTQSNSSLNMPEKKIVSSAPKSSHQRTPVKSRSSANLIVKPALNTDVLPTSYHSPQISFKTPSAHKVPLSSSGPKLGSVSIKIGGFAQTYKVGDTKLKKSIEGVSLTKSTDSLNSIRHSDSPLTTTTERTPSKVIDLAQIKLVEVSAQSEMLSSESIKSDKSEKVPALMASTALLFSTDEISQLFQNLSETARGASTTSIILKTKNLSNIAQPTGSHEKSASTGDKSLRKAVPASAVSIDRQGTGSGIISTYSYDTAASFDTAASRGTADSGETDPYWAKLIPVQSEYQLVFVPLNAMSDIFVYSLDTSKAIRLGRNNTTGHKRFKPFGTLVVSRNHLDIFFKNGRVYIKDSGSSSGTFRNNVRLSQTGQPSPEVEVLTGDYIQLGRDFTNENDILDTEGRVEVKKRCVKMQLVIIPPGVRTDDAINGQGIPIEPAVNRSGILQRIALSPSHASLAERAIVIGNVTKLTVQNIKEAKPSFQPAASNLNTQIPETFKLAAKIAIEDANATENAPSVQSSSRKVSATGTIKEFAQNAKETFILQSVTNSGKIRRIQLNSSQGTTVFSAVMRKWEDKGYIQAHHSVISIQDETGRISRDLELTSPDAFKNISKKTLAAAVGVSFTLYNAGAAIATLILSSEMKLEVVPKAPDEFIIVITGLFKEQRFMIVKKAPNSRQQGLIGECMGKNQVKKVIAGFESLWLSTLSLDREEGQNPLVLAGLAFLCAIGGV